MDRKQAKPRRFKATGINRGVPWTCYFPTREEAKAFEREQREEESRAAREDLAFNRD